MTSVRAILTRGMVQAVAAPAVVTGLVGWIAGAQYGHALVTLGLAVYIPTFFTRLTSFRRSWGALELAEAAFSMRVYTGNSEPAAAQFAAEATALAREHAASISRAALAEAADLLDRAEFADEARELEELSDRKESS
ncbi:hypothetical protein AB0L64_16055 [Kribbella sp. NPDC051936]|uniref:hypothetical protein n=1 Tax=Kribbella sp. NPDC051936 TaxID=3154946 RepID=UPI0034128803